MNVRKNSSFSLDSLSSSSSTSSLLKSACKNRYHHHCRRGNSPARYGDADLSEITKFLLQRSFDDMNMQINIVKDHPGNQPCSICEAEVRSLSCSTSSSTKAQLRSQKVTNMQGKQASQQPSRQPGRRARQVDM